MLSENESVLEELDYEMDGENDTDDRDKEDKTPQKLIKLLFMQLIMLFQIVPNCV